MIYAETVLQPSLHSARSFTSILLNEADIRSVNVDSVSDEFEAAGDNYEHYHELQQEITTKIEESNYTIIDENDCYLIFPHGITYEQIEAEQE